MTSRDELRIHHITLDNLTSRHVAGAERDGQPGLVLLQLQVRATTRRSQLLQQFLQQHRLRNARNPLPRAHLPKVSLLSFVLRLNAANLVFVFSEQESLLRQTNGAG